MSKRRRPVRPRPAAKGQIEYRFVPEQNKEAILANLRLLVTARAELDEFERDWVIRALVNGASFAEVAEVLGESRQAVHRRYGGQLHAVDGRPDGNLSYTTIGARSPRTAGDVNDR